MEFYAPKPRYDYKRPERSEISSSKVLKQRNLFGFDITQSWPIYVLTAQLRIKVFFHLHCVTDVTSNTVKFKFQCMHWVLPVRGCVLAVLALCVSVTSAYSHWCHNSICHRVCLFFCQVAYHFFVTYRSSEASPLSLHIVSPTKHETKCGIEWTLIMKVCLLALHSCPRGNHYRNMLLTKIHNKSGDRKHSSTWHFA